MEDEFLISWTFIHILGCTVIIRYFFVRLSLDLAFFIHLLYVYVNRTELTWSGARGARSDCKILESKKLDVALPRKKQVLSASVSATIAPARHNL